jgi:hypothetical protein
MGKKRKGRKGSNLALVSLGPKYTPKGENATLMQQKAIAFEGSWPHFREHGLSGLEKIPQIKRILCWNTYIGEEVGKALCLCCNTFHITQHNFHCGHVVAEANGGSLSIESLRPICDKCNCAMGTQDMRLFAKKNSTEISNNTRTFANDSLRHLEMN